MTAPQTKHPKVDPMPGSPGQAPGGPGSTDRSPGMRALQPLLIDVGVPVGTYYLLRDAFGVSLWLSLALSSLGPAMRAIAGLVAERKLNLLAVLMLAVNLTGIAVSFLTGNPRSMIAKDSIISGVIAFAILGSVVLRRPLMSAGLKPFMTRGEPQRTAAWDRLARPRPGSAGSNCCSAPSGASRCWPSAPPAWWVRTRCRSRRWCGWAR